MDSRSLGGIFLPRPSLAKLTESGKATTTRTEGFDPPPSSLLRVTSNRQEDCLLGAQVRPFPTADPLFSSIFHEAKMVPLWLHGFPCCAVGKFIWRSVRSAGPAERRAEHLG